MFVTATYQSKTWLVGYDIANPKRLRSVHRFVAKSALSLQYSTYCLNATDKEIEDFLSVLSCIIEPAVDDVRVYHLPAKTRIWRYGVGGTAEGVMLSAEAVIDRLLSPEKVSA